MAYKTISGLYFKVGSTGLHLGFFFCPPGMTEYEKPQPGFCQKPEVLEACY